MEYYWKYHSSINKKPTRTKESWSVAGSHSLLAGFSVAMLVKAAIEENFKVLPHICLPCAEQPHSVWPDVALSTMLGLSLHYQCLRHVLSTSYSAETSSGPMTWRSVGRPLCATQPCKGIPINNSYKSYWGWEGLQISAEPGVFSGFKEHLFLHRTQDQFPAHTCPLTAICNSSLRRSDAVFSPLRAPGVHMVHIHTCRQNTPPHTIF
jgi:hypothetical protein